MLMRRIVLACVLLLAAPACSVFRGQGASPTPNAADKATMAALGTKVAAELTPTAQPAAPLPPVATATFTPAAPYPPPELPTQLPTQVPPGGILGTHIVRQGESLFCIGRGYGVLPSAIAEVNGRPATATLRIGEALKVPAVQWLNIPPGPVCAPQFASPFSGLLATPPAASPLAVTLDYGCIFNCGSQDGEYLLRFQVQASGGVPPYSFNPGQNFDLTFPHCVDGSGTVTVTSADGQTVAESWFYHDVSCPPTGRGQEIILLLEPGLNSSVISPVHVAGEADPTFEQSLVVQVSDEAGVIIATVPAQISADVGQRGPFSVDVSFQVSSDQPGRISVFAASARDGGLTHLASVEVTLRESGAAALKPGWAHEETIALFTPAFLATVSRGTAHITGFSDYVFEGQMPVVICGEGGSGAPDLICGTQGNILGRGLAFVASPDVGQPGPFTADVSYTVTAPVRGRIAVYDISARDGGILHLASQEVTLTP